MRAYEEIDHGFLIKLDKKIYSYDAVMKALYRFHDRYIISYETENEFVHVYFEKSNLGHEMVENEVREIMKELSFQMIRQNTMYRTKGIRELLVARSLYATCIEPEREAQPDVQEEKADWQADQNHIFASWAAEQ